MSKSINKKCGYSHCKHESNIIDTSCEKYEMENGRYYHPDCKHEKDTIYNIKDYWYRNIDSEVIFNQLTKIIEKLIYKEKLDADFVLYALKKKSKYLKHPPGLIYATKDKELKNEWEFNNKLKNFYTSKDDVKIEEKNEPSFVYKDTGNAKKFGDIFGGK